MKTPRVQIQMFTIGGPEPEEAPPFTRAQQKMLKALARSDAQRRELILRLLKPLPPYTEEELNRDGQTL